MADHPDILPATDAIARRFGADAADEWRVLLNQFVLGHGFALIVLSVPDRDGAALCRQELERFLAAGSQRLIRVEPDTPDDLGLLTPTLLNLPVESDAGAVWVSAVIGATAADFEEWNGAWRRALGSLNQQRNPFRRHFALPVIVVGAPWVAILMRDMAPDVWSVRSLSIHIEPTVTRRFEDWDRQRTEMAEPDREQPGPTRAPDPEMALHAAKALRGQPGQERTLADLLARAAAGFAARGDWEAAERAWREAAQLYGLAGANSAAAVAWTRLGDSLVTVGNLTGAFEAFRAGMAISERLACQDPDNTQWQRDYSVSHNKIGDVQVAQGDLPGALQAFHAGMAISERLARQDPDNTQWQRDLSISHERIGDVQVAQGDLPGALQAFRAGMAISERLARLDSRNAGWQRDVLVSLTKLAGVAAAAGDRAEAIAQAERAVALARELVERFPGNPQHVRDLPAVEAMAQRLRGAGA